MTRHVDMVAFALLALLAFGVLLVVLRAQVTQRAAGNESSADTRRATEVTGSVGTERRLRALSGTSDEIFSALYAPVLKNARYCLQTFRTRVPASHASRFEIAGILQATTQLLGQRPAVTCHRIASRTREQQEPCWTYTYYCAVVCCYVLCAVQSIEVKVSDGQTGRIWNLILDPMISDDEIQAVRVIRAPQLVPGWRNVLILPRFIPRQGLDWIVRTGDPFSALACTVTGVAGTDHPFCKAVYDAVGDPVPNNSDHAADQNDSESTTVHPQEGSTEYGMSEMDQRSDFEDRLSPTDKPAVVENQTDMEGGHTKGQTKRRRKQGVVDSVWASG